MNWSENYRGAVFSSLYFFLSPPPRRRAEIDAVENRRRRDTAVRVITCQHVLPRAFDVRCGPISQTQLCATADNRCHASAAIVILMSRSHEKRGSRSNERERARTSAVCLNERKCDIVIETNCSFAFIWTTWKWSAGDKRRESGKKRNESRRLRVSLSRARVRRVSRYGLSAGINHAWYLIAFYFSQRSCKKAH